MDLLKLLCFITAAVFAASFASAATIYGSIYDLSLKKVNNARVEINTSPKQFFIAQNSSYSFRAPFGSYKIKAQLMQKNNILASAEENITTNQDGDYVLDIILFPNIEEGVENVEINAPNVPDNNGGRNYALLGLLALTVIIFPVAYHFYFKHKKPKYDDADELKNLMEIIKKEGGRATQKEIRKKMPLSEAKISLMITELEHNGVVEKIKKGRGNVIILKTKET